MTSLSLSILLLIMVGVERTLAQEYSYAELESLRGKTYLNEQAVVSAVGWEEANQNTDPYPSDTDPYDTVINEGVDCYVFFFDQFEKTSYKMLSLTPEEANRTADVCQYGTELTGELPACEGLVGAEKDECFEQECNKTEIRKSHLGQCGACSNLEDLYIYLTIPDLRGPVTNCGILSIFGIDILDCILDIGFQLPCAQIWRWNTINTRKLEDDGGCFGVCLAYAFADDIEEIENPVFGSPCSPDECFTTINGEQTCPVEIYESGSEFRLNACLQCDECRSGPIFQKIARRTRRNSGIESGIDRPDDSICDDCIHDYGLPTGAPPDFITRSPTTAPEFPILDLIIPAIFVALFLLGCCLICL